MKEEPKVVVVLNGGLIDEVWIDTPGTRVLVLDTDKDAADTTLHISPDGRPCFVHEADAALLPKPVEYAFETADTHGLSAEAAEALVSGMGEIYGLLAAGSESEALEIAKRTLRLINGELAGFYPEDAPHAGVESG